MFRLVMAAKKGEPSEQPNDKNKDNQSQQFGFFENQNGELELNNGFSNEPIAKGKMKDAKYEYDGESIIWWSGTFTGTLSNCMFVDGTLNGDFDGFDFGGTFKGGTFSSGVFNNGKFDGGTFTGGTFTGGTFQKGEFAGGTFAGGTFAGGKFTGGTFNGGTWTAGSDSWKNGIWERGFDKNHNVHAFPPPWDGAIEDKEYANFTGTIYLFKPSQINNQCVNPSVTNANFIKKGQTLEWKNGTWNKGTWMGGTWEDGTWKTGIWTMGTWEDGTWMGGNWTTGTWEDGIWNGGTWKDGTWMGGTWNGGIWQRGKDKNGIQHPNAKTRGKHGNDSPDTWEEMTATKESSYIDFTGAIDFRSLKSQSINAEVKKATFVMSQNGILWQSGTWKSGTWTNGVWRDGEWLSGTWENGVWCSGTWKGGYDAHGQYHSDPPDQWDNASIAKAPGRYENFSGTIKVMNTNGKAENATFEVDGNGNITWMNGTWETGVLQDCQWKNGTFKDGIFANGVFDGGTFDRGMFNSSEFRNGTWTEKGMWSMRSKWTNGTDSNGNRHSDPPMQWKPRSNNPHHSNRDYIIDNFIHLGKLERVTFTWDEKKPNNPKVYKIYESGVAVVINPFKNLLITRMPLNSNHLEEYFCLPKYLGTDDNGKPVIGKTASTSNIPPELKKRANFFDTFDGGNLISTEPDTHAPVIDPSTGNFTQYYQQAIDAGWKYIP